MAKGDILFYVGDPHNLFDWFIIKRTHGKYVHCGVDMGDGTSIEALSGGVTIRKTPYNSMAIYVYHDPRITDNPKLDEALAYVRREVGHPYSFADIFDQAVSFLNPHGPFLVTPRAVDCSELVTRYLIHLDYPLPLYDEQKPYLVSPNDLARLFGLSVL